MPEVIHSFYRAPFALGSPLVLGFRPGMSLREMAERMPDMPPDFLARGEILINGHPIARENWGAVRPKPSRAGQPVVVSFHAPIRGGGGGEKKNTAALIGSLVIAVAATAVSAGALGPAGLAIAGASFAAGGVGAIIASTAISLIGGLLITALTPPPSIPSIDQQVFDRDRKGAASAGGNILEPNGPIPRVIGTRKVFPPLAAEPFVYYDGENEIVEAVYALAGPHDLADLRIDGAPIGGANDVSFELREGWPEDAPLTLVTRQSRTAPLQVEFSTHVVEPDNQASLVSVAVENLPKFHGMSSRHAPDEIQLQLTFAGGLSKDGAIATKLRVPFRIRIRRSGDATWINLPEIHYQHASLRQLRTTIRLVFQQGGQPSIPGVPTTAAFVEARKLSPGQTGSPTTEAWTADAYFSTGAGDDYLTLGTEGSTKVTNVNLVESGAEFYLDTAVFTPGIYEIEIMRGAAFNKALYNAALYQYDGVGLDFFWYRDSGTIPETRENVIDTCHLVRAVSVWNEAPIRKSGFALIAIRAVNRRVDRVSTVASGYVKDWNGSAWATWTTTSNPAPHFRDVLTGALNLDPLPISLLDDDSLVDWRAACAANGYTCDHIAEGNRVAEVLLIAAGCGFARPFQSEVWGVFRDFDRSAEGPVQIFSPRNSSDFKWSKAFSRLPDGFRINFQDEGFDYSAAQLVVYHENVPGPRLEQVTYEGLVDIQKLRDRAAFDLKQARLRSTQYSLTAPAEAIVCRRGSLVGVTHDVLTTQAAFARISSVQVTGPNVTGVTLDADVEVWNEADLHAVTDLHGVADLHLVGRRTGVAIRRTNGATTVHLLANPTGVTDAPVLATPVPNDLTAGGPFDPAQIPEIAEGCLAVLGGFGTEFKRLLVSQVDPAPDLMATLTLIDEAQELWT